MRLRAKRGDAPLRRTRSRRRFAAPTIVQESAPERIELKRKLLAEIDRHAPPEALIGSSTSGLLPTDLQASMRHPERLVIAHPFNPVYLLPLVEVVGGRKTAPATHRAAPRPSMPPSA